jgi:formylglycine-generating enzyme required for sulfatase activity
MPQLEKFEHYELLKNQDGSLVELGHGAMGVTYKAFDTSLHCNVAIKVISAANVNDPMAAERFLREARGTAQLRHRNVATVYHLGQCGDSYFYAMEFIEGETVEARVRREGPLAVSLAVEIASQVAAALSAAARQGLVHRDIKPSNLMLVREDDGELIAKVIDFGLVKFAMIDSSAAASLTSSGFVGTPYFASPEQLDQHTEDIRSDIYSLGVTLWFMLTGKPTFIGSVASVIAQHLDKPPAFESLALLPAPVLKVLRRMLEKDVAARIQTPQELRTELKRCLETLQNAESVVEIRPATMTYGEAAETLVSSQAPAAAPPAQLPSVEGNGEVRRAMSGHEPFPSAQEFAAPLHPTADGTTRTPQVETAPDRAAASASAARSSQPAEKSAPTVPMPGEPAAPPVASPVNRTSEAGPVKARGARHSLPAMAGAAALVAGLAVGLLLFFGHKSGPLPAPPPPPVTPPAGTPVAAMPRQPPQAGLPWSNSLGMKYLPVGGVWFAATETRVRDFDEFVKETNYDATGGMDSLQQDGFKDHGHTWKDPGFKQSPEHPVVGVSREDANFFCKWLTEKERAAGALTPNQSYRLPTDREWSEAVGLPSEPGATPEERSGKVRNVYPWGYSFPPSPNAGNYAGEEAAAGAPEKWPIISHYRDPFPRTAPVPASKPNERGLADLGGNVWEWCHDAFGKTNPRWGVLRGGSWATSHPEELLSSYRRGFDPSFREDDVGFRCVIATDAGDR